MTVAEDAATTMTAWTMIDPIVGEVLHRDGCEIHARDHTERGRPAGRLRPSSTRTFDRTFTPNVVCSDRARHSGHRRAWHRGIARLRRQDDGTRCRFVVTNSASRGTRAERTSCHLSLAPRCRRRDDADAPRQGCQNVESLPVREHSLPSLVPLAIE